MTIGLFWLVQSFPLPLKSLGPCDPPGPGNVLPHHQPWHRQLQLFRTLLHGSCYCLHLATKYVGFLGFLQFPNVFINRWFHKPWWLWWPMATYGGCSRALHLLHQQHLQLLLVANFQSEHLVGLLPPKEPLHRQQTPGNLLKSDEINLQKSSPVKQPMAFRKLAQSRVRSILAKCFFWVKAIGYGAPNSIYIYITYIYKYLATGGFF